jgi:hypothetical protein
MSTERATLDDRDAEAVLDVLRAGTEHMLNDPFRIGSVVRLPAEGSLLITGDLHDNPMHLAKVITLARLDKSPSNHVIVHELIHGDRLINGLDLSYRMLVKIARLMREYPGQIHPLLANHELSQMDGHPVSKGNGNMTENFDEGLDWVFGDDGRRVAAALRTFIRAMPLALFTENGVCCAHSLPGPSQMVRFDSSIINRPLVEADYAPLVGSAWMMVWGRGQTTEQMELIAEEWDVKLFCLGHAFVENGIAIGGPRTILLNTDHERATVLSMALDEEAFTIETAMFSAMPLAAYGDLT